MLIYSYAGKIIDLARFGGGSISHVNKIGETTMKLRACYDFSGTYDIKSDLISVKHFSTPRMVLNDERTIYNKDVYVREEARQWYREYLGSTATHRV